MTYDRTFWDFAERLLAGHRVVIDRPKGSRHPRHPSIVYPLDYGYIEGTASMDGGGIDVWVGSLGQAAGVSAAICTLDLTKGDSEVKFLIGCTEGDLGIIDSFHNEGNMRGLLIRRV